MSIFNIFKSKAPEPKAPEVLEPAPEAQEIVEAEAPTVAIAEPTPTGWLQRLTGGLQKSASAISESIGGIFTKRKLDAAMLEALEETLILADVGATVAADLVAKLRAHAFDKEITPEEVRAFLAADIAARLAPVAIPLVPNAATRPHVVLVVGVNGNGKTTTIGKLAAQWSREGKRVMLAAGDTFRAAAVEQLQVWGARSGCPVVFGAHEADSASVAFRALEDATAQGMDVLLIDTAGRLHNKANLMQELEKIIRVLRKLVPDAPHSVLLVLDATTGQNALSQVKAFRELTHVSGLIVTKLDGTAKAGVVVALAQQFGLPIHAIGVGEGLEDLQPFTPESFARSLVGLVAA